VTLTVPRGSEEFTREACKPQRAMQGAPGRLICFGKLPLRGDFIRHNAGGAALRSLDTWFQEGIYAARAQRAFSFDEAFEASPAYGFFHDPGAGARALIGAVAPSRDQVGRRYPFLIAFEAAEALRDVADVARIPVTFASFFAVASAVLREAVAGRTEPQALFDHPGLSRASAEGASADAFEALLKATTLGSFWRDLWGEAADDRRYLILKNLIDVVTPLQQGVPVRFPLVLRFPLAPGGREDAFDAAVWLAAGFNLLGNGEVRPTFFWPLREQEDGKAPSLLLFLRPPLARAFVYLLAADRDGDDLCDLEHMGAAPPADAARSLAPAHRQMLETLPASLWDFLQALAAAP
jgi:type VI secretion system protein ImpM